MKKIIKTRQEMLKVLNSPKNKNGDTIKIIMISSAGSEGLDLKNIRQIHIMEPYWNEVRVKQVIGREELEIILIKIYHQKTKCYCF